VILALADDLGAESSDGALAKELVVVLLNVDLLLNGFNSLHSNIACALETISDLERVNALVEELLSLVEEGTGKNYDTGSTITDFVILRLRKLDEEAGSLVLNLHLLDNSGAIIGNDNITIRAEKLVLTIYKLTSRAFCPYPWGQERFS
jgi:hypothetical protein